MFCKNCGSEIKDEAKFCCKCGVKQETQTDLASTNENNVNTGTKDNKTTKENPKKINILSIIIAIIVFCLSIKGVQWGFSNISDWAYSITNNNSSKPSAGTDFSSLNKKNSSPAINIKSISFDPYMGEIEYEFENISNKGIAYIKFETYFYDRMGGVLEIYDNDYSVNLKYTGPLYSGNSDLAHWEYLFEMPTGTAVVYPKKITVTFIDDEEITFENSLYCYADDFYGGELKDKK